MTERVLIEITYRADGNLHCDAVGYCLNNFIALGCEVDMQFGMTLHYLLHRIGQSIGVSPCREGKHVGDVVDGRRGILQALIIDTRLGVAQRNAL